MRFICTLFGLILIAVAVMYLQMPANALPSFFPGHETGLARIRVKHGMVSGALGFVLIAVGWWMGRRR